MEARAWPICHAWSRAAIRGFLVPLLIRRFSSRRESSLASSPGQTGPISTRTGCTRSFRGNGSGWLPNNLPPRRCSMSLIREKQNFQTLSWESNLFGIDACDSEESWCWWHGDLHFDQISTDLEFAVPGSVIKRPRSGRICDGDLPLQYRPFKQDDRQGQENFVFHRSPGASRR